MTGNSDVLYCTLSQNVILPASISKHFRELDLFLREIIASATKDLIIVMPYVTTSGIERVADSIAASLHQGAWLRFLVGALRGCEAQNRNAVGLLYGAIDDDAEKRRIRILCASNPEEALFHSKLVIADGMRGYLGSANLSLSAMEKNFEDGVSLRYDQARAVSELISFWEGSGVVVDQTSKFIC